MKSLPLKIISAGHHTHARFEAIEECSLASWGIRDRGPGSKPIFWFADWFLKEGDYLDFEAKPLCDKSGFGYTSAQIQQMLGKYEERDLRHNTLLINPYWTAGIEYLEFVQRPTQE